MVEAPGMHWDWGPRQGPREWVALPWCMLADNTRRRCSFIDHIQIIVDPVGIDVASQKDGVNKCY